MLKSYSTHVVFAEFPDEIALAFNISNCPCHCDHCSEPWLRADVGDSITEEYLDAQIKAHPGITMIGLMGGDSDHQDVARIADYVHKKYPSLLVGMYSGLDCIDLSLAQYLDYYKVGRWIAPTGNPENWKDYSWGPLVFPNSNQKMWKIENGVMQDITFKFRLKPIHDLTRYII